MGHLKRIMEQYQEPEFTAQGTPIEDFGPMPDDAMGSVIPYQRRVVKRIVIGTDGKRKTINRIMLVPVPPTVRRPATRVVRKIVHVPVKPLEVAEYVERHADDFAAKCGPSFKLEF